MTQCMKFILVNESGLYTAIFGSKLPAAQAFARWVTSDVLPCLRKHGGYLDPSLVQEMIKRPEIVQVWLEELAEEQTKNAVLKAENDALAPKAEYYDIVLEAENALITTIVAKDYGWSAYKLNRKLKELGVQYSRGGMWVMYQPYADKGYTDTRTSYDKYSGRARMDTLWTQKGRQFIFETLKAHGILPMSGSTLDNAIQEQ